MTTAHERMTAGYAAKQPGKSTRPPFLVDHKLERLLRLREADPKTYAVFGPETRTSLGFYEENRTAANYHPTETTDDNHG